MQSFSQRKIATISSSLLIVGLMLIGCTSQSSLPSASTPQPAATPFRLPTLLPTNTPQPTPTRTMVPTFTIAPTPTLPLGLGWYPIPTLPFVSVTAAIARSYIGIKVPPPPEELVEEYGFQEFIGEAPPWIIVHKIFIMRQGNARMLWIGILSQETGPQGYVRIFDSIPLPPMQDGDTLIAFSCAHNNESDPALIVIAGGHPREVVQGIDIRYAWRIDPSSIRLTPVSYRDISCFEM